MARGEALEVLVRERCLPVELERYNLFIGDLERVVSLLLCLSARLARVQNALSTVDQHTDAEEKVRKQNITQSPLQQTFSLLCFVLTVLFLSAVVLAATAQKYLNYSH